jgi:hypothetical protein
VSRVGMTLAAYRSHKIKLILPSPSSGLQMSSGKLFRFLMNIENARNAPNENNEKDNEKASVEPLIKFRHDRPSTSFDSYFTLTATFPPNEEFSPFSIFKRRFFVEQKLKIKRD